MKKNKNLLTLILVMLFTITSCNTVSEKHLELEKAQTTLEENITMYESVWDKVINDRQIDLINEDYFDKDVVVLGTS